MKAAMAASEQVTGVTHSQPNYIYRLVDGGADEASPAGLTATTSDGIIEQTSATPNATDVNDSYSKMSSSYNEHLRAINAYEAWSLIKGEDANPAITVAVLDTGYDQNHADLVGNVIASYDATSSAAGGTKRNSGVSDLEGHGTHVAGIIAAVANNNRGVAGVSYNAKVLPIQVFYYDASERDVFSDSVDLAAAYTFLMSEAASGYNVRVANMSLGSESSPDNDDRIVLSKIKSAFENNGIVTVCAAGNSGYTSAYANFPSDYLAGCGLGVIALDSNLQRANYSNYNQSSARVKNISAPGEVYSTTLGGKYGYKTGTSMASPIVAGVVALVFSANPSLSASDAVSFVSKTASDLRYSRAGEVAGTGWDRYTGFGNVNAEAAVQSALNGGSYISGASAMFADGSIPLSVASATGDSDSRNWSWSSSDPSIADVSSSGVVTSGIDLDSDKTEKVTITATCDADSSISLSNTITIYSSRNPFFVDGESVTETTLKAGDYIDLGLEKIPGSWTIATTNPSIASIDSITGDNKLRIYGVSAGTAYITHTLQSATPLQRSFKINVASRPLSDAAIALSATRCVYTGSPIYPSVNAKIGSYSLRPGTDFTIAYADNVLPGTATVTLAGRNGYTGTVTKRFTISKAAITSINMTTKSYVYNGKAKRPSLTVRASNGKTLKEGVDYKVTLANNVNAGTARITVSAIGNYTGTSSNTFTIKKASLKSLKLSKKKLVYNGKKRSPSATVKGSNGLKLKAGRDYKLKTPKGRKKPGTYTYVATGKGNYTGKVKAKFKIVRRR